MNWQHLQAFVWLRWRLMLNQWRRAGRVNAAVMMIAAVGLLLLAIPLFVGCFAAGWYGFPKATPTHLLFVWDALVVAFSFFWAVGLLAELQRTESLSLAKFMHLPVSVNGAFMINYLSSLVTLTTIIFVPLMFGLALALVATRGFAQLGVLPLTAAFILMVSAVSYQFQGWMASLMTNPRRRRTVVMIATLTFVLIFQLPNLLRFSGPFAPGGQKNPAEEFNEQSAELNRALHAGEIEGQEYVRRSTELVEEMNAKTSASNNRTAEQATLIAWYASLVLPIGWLPMGVMYAAEGNVMPALLALVGMTSIGATCLWRAYRTTVGLYQGRFTSTKVVATPAVAARDKPAVKSRGTLLEARLPGVSEPVAAIALGSFRSLMRAPESKILLVMPLVFGVVFGSTMLRTANKLPEEARMLMAIGAIGTVLFFLTNLIANQFGFDRDGFRVYVLCSAPRRDILMGKNLAFAPLVATLAIVLLAVIEFVAPLRFDHLLALAPQLVSMYLVFCLLMNLLSIYAPLRIAAGTLKPSSPQLLPVLYQMVMMLVIFPLAEAPTLLPLGAEALSESLGWTTRAPICLALTLVQCAVVVLIYRLAMNWEGDLLRAREQQILNALTDRGT